MLRFRGGRICSDPSNSGSAPSIARMVRAGGNRSCRRHSPGAWLWPRSRFGHQCPNSECTIKVITRYGDFKVTAVGGFSLRARQSGGCAVLHQCIRLLIGACCAPSHHGYQRAYGLFSGQASKMGHSGHQGSHAPERPILHVVSSSRRPRQVKVWRHIIACSLFHLPVPLFVPAARSFVPTCACAEGYPSSNRA